jgi:hypothetical protein
MSSCHSNRSAFANRKVVASTISYKFGKETFGKTATKKRHFRSIWWRTKSQTLLQSPKEEKSAELKKSGPLETPKGEFKRLRKSPVVIQTESATDRIMGLEPIEELSFDEDVLDNRDENPRLYQKESFLGQRFLLCGCL